jgi:predicted aldo/keto reductase-like oxidoreductase
VLARERPADSNAAWALRYAGSLEHAPIVLSGMSDMAQVEENIALFSKNDPVSLDEKKMLQEAIKPLLNLVPCTSCRYCCEACQKNLDIPKLIAMYNEAKNGDNHSWMVLGFTLGVMKEIELPQSCIGCGECVKLCPQEIDIPDIMEKFAGQLEKRKKP